MATEILRPNSDVSVASYYVGSASRYQNVDEEVASDADYNYALGSVTLQDILGLPDSSGVGAISNVSLRTRLWTDGSGASNLHRVRPKLVVGGTFYYGTARGFGAPVGEYTDDWATNPTTGVAWTWADINSLQCGYEVRGDEYFDGKETFYYGGYVSQQYIIVTYTPPVGRSYGYIIG